MNPMVIRIAANLEAFKANMAEMRVQLETNASAMKRMSSAFDGSKIIGDANAMVKAIGDIGGASSLTVAEQKRVNATVTEALAKYKALGREAPPELMALRDATSQAATPMQNLTSRAIAMGTAIGSFVGNMAWSAVNKLGSEIGEFAQRGVQLNAVQSSFERLAATAGLSSQKMLAEMKIASRGLVSEYDLMTAANKAMLLGLPVSVATMGELTKAATTLGRAMGQNATKSVDDLITALGRSSPMILDNLGITVKVGEANDIYAAKLKTTADKLDDAQKKTAFYEEAMRRAKERTEELGDSTETLGEIIQRNWTSIGDVVSRAVSIMDVGIGSVLSKSWSEMAKFMVEAAKNGVGVALAMEAAGQKIKTAVIPLTENQQALVRLNQTMGDARKTGAELAQIMGVNLPSVLAYAKTLTDEKRKADEKLTEEQKKAREAAEKLREEFQKKVDAWTGVELQREVAELRRVINAAGGAAALGAVEYKKLENQLSSLKAEGAKLDAEFSAIARTHDLLNTKIPVTTNAYASLNAILRTLPTTRLELPAPVFSAPISDDPYGIITQIEQSLILAGKDTRIQLAAPPIAESFGRSMREALGDSLAGLGNVILNAIQNGGGVGRAVFSSIGLDLGNELGKQIAAGLGGTLGRLLGGLAGPVGSMLGNLVGGWIDRIFGNNPGRDNIVSFAQRYGGFDALRQQMLVLGEQGEQLWIQLTQNARGPAQVAQAIAAIEEAFRRYEEAARQAAQTTEETSNQEVGFISKVSKAIKSKIEALDSQRESVYDSIREELDNPEYDEQGNRIYGVIEAQGLARLAEIDRQKEELATQMAEASAKVMDTAKITAEGIRDILTNIFKDPFKILIDTSQLDALLRGGGTTVPRVPLSSGGGYGGGSSLSGLSMPLRTPANATVIINNPQVRNDRDITELTRQVAKVMPGYLDLIGARG